MNLKKIEKDMYKFKQNKSEEIILNSIPYPSFGIFCRLVFLEYLHLRVDQPFCPEKYKYNLTEKQNRQFPLKVKVVKITNLIVVKHRCGKLQFLVKIKNPERKQKRVDRYSLHRFEVFHVSISRKMRYWKTMN